MLVVPARGETLSNAWPLWWERNVNSFAVAGENAVFGRRGELNAALEADGFLFHEGGLDVTFTSPDDDLEDRPFDEGVGAKRCLVFIGDQILLGWSPALLAAGRYRVPVVRVQF